MTSAILHRLNRVFNLLAFEEIPNTGRAGAAVAVRNSVGVLRRGPPMPLVGIGGFEVVLFIKMFD